MFCGLGPDSLAQSQVDEKRLELLEGELKRYPENLKIALVLGGLLRKEGRQEEANNLVDEAMNLVAERIAEEGDSSERYYLIGMGALFLNRNYLALDRFQLALSLEPEREEIHLGLARALLSLKRVDEAASALELATVLFPESSTVKSQLAELYYKEEEFDKAISILEELRVIEPENPNVFNRLLSVYIEAGDVANATPLLNQLENEGKINALQRILQIFRMHLSNGDIRDARVELQNASDIDGDGLLVKGAFGEYYAVQAREAEKEGNFRRSVLFWERSLESAPNVWRTQYSLALALAALEEHEAALERYLTLLEKKPADPIFYKDLSISLSAMDQFDAALRVLDLGVKLATSSNSHSALEKLRTTKSEILSDRQLAGSGLE